MEQLAAWLEEQTGEMGLALEEQWVQPLGELHGKGKWSLKNVVKEAEGMSVTKQMNLVWTAIMAECARMIADTGAEPPSPLDQTLAMQWALTPTALFTLGSTVTREEVTATIDPPHTRDASYGRTNAAPIVPAVVPAVAPGLPPPPSCLTIEDMLAEGANNVTDLLFSSVSLELGRPAVDKELEGGEYASCPLPFAMASLRLRSLGASRASRSSSARPRSTVTSCCVSATWRSSRGAS